MTNGNETKKETVSVAPDLTDAVESMADEMEEIFVDLEELNAHTESLRQNAVDHLELQILRYERLRELALKMCTELFGYNNIHDLIPDVCTTAEEVLELLESEE
jgi:hypothetical protein